MNHFDHVKLLLQSYKDNLAELHVELHNNWPVEVQTAYSYLVENLFDYRLTIERETTM